MPVQRKRSRQAGKKPAKPQPEASATDVLTPAQRAFVVAYARYRGNGTRAWMALHPKCSARAAASAAWEALRNPDIRKAVDAEFAARLARLKIDGDDVLLLVAAQARFDPADIYDPNGKLLAVHLWPEEARLSVESIEDGKVKFASKTAARRMLLEQAGKLTGVGDGLTAIAQILAAAHTEAAE